MNLLTSVFRGYQNVLRKYPLCSQAIQAGILMGTGDTIAQTFVEKKKLADIDLIRVARFTGIGLLIAGPALKTWYWFLDRRIGQSGSTIAIKKMLLDQFVFAPVFVGVLLSSIGLTSQQSLANVQQKLVSDYPEIMVTNYKVWPFVQMFNFYMVPLNYQVLVVQVVAVFWNTYLSYVSNKPLDTLDEKKEALTLKKPVLTPG